MTPEQATRVAEWLGGVFTDDDGGAAINKGTPFPRWKFPFVIGYGVQRSKKYPYYLVSEERLIDWLHSDSGVVAMLKKYTAKEGKIAFVQEDGEYIAMLEYAVLADIELRAPTLPDALIAAVLSLPELEKQNEL